MQSFFVSKMTWLLFVERQKLRTWSQDKSKEHNSQGSMKLRGRPCRVAKRRDGSE